MHNAAVAKRHKKRPEMSTQEKQKRTKLNYKNRTECNFTLEIMAESLMIVSASISLIIFTFFQCCTSLINSLSLHFIKFNQNANFFFSLFATFTILIRSIRCTHIIQLNMMSMLCLRGKFD